MKFVILGAGLSGLTCAAVLRRHGHDVSVIERDLEVGGLARSHRTNGYTFDYGPHFLFGERVYGLIEEQFPEIELRQLSSTHERMYFRQEYFQFPFDPKNILLRMERRSVPGVLCELFLRKMFKAGISNQSKNVEDWVIQAVGREIYNYISLGGYIQKLYGLPPTEISCEWGIQKLKFLAKWREANFMTLIARSLSEGKNIKKRSIHYPVAAGIDHIPLRISEAFIGLGGKLLLNSEVVSVQHNSRGISVTFKNDGELRRLNGDFLISTVPITRLVEMLSPRLPEKVRKKSASLRYRTLLLLFLCIRRNLILDDQCIYFTELPIFFRRITEFKRLESNMAPQDKTSLCIEITCFENDEVCDKEKEALFETVIGQLEKMGYLKEEDVEEYQFLRIPFAYPVYEIQYNSILEEILGHLSAYRNMISVGRQGLFFYNAMNNSIISSYELSKKLSICEKTGYGEIINETYRARAAKYE